MKKQFTFAGLLAVLLVLFALLIYPNSLLLYEDWLPWTELPS